MGLELTLALRIADDSVSNWIAKLFSIRQGSSLSGPS
jgi:hypothetical protein